MSVSLKKEKKKRKRAVTKPMTKAAHRKRHKELHRALDELVADFIGHGEPGTKLPTKTSVLELMEWSHQQTIDPTDPR